MQFTGRITRSDLGPTLDNGRYPVANPKTDIGADTLNLAFHQAAGMSRTIAEIGFVSVRVVVEIKKIGDTEVKTYTPEVVYQGFAFDPSRTLCNLQMARSTAGLYAFSFDREVYPDGKGQDVTVEINTGSATAQKLSDGNLVDGIFTKTGPRSWTVELKEVVSQNFCDVDFIVQLF
jgi:hypothetical protein